jgi:hypothetical protein
MSFLFIYFDFPRPRSRIPIIPYNIKFVQRGFTERDAFKERIRRVVRGFTVFVDKLRLHVSEFTSP